MVKKHEKVLRDLTVAISSLDPVCSIVVYGSIGRGNYHEGSDIDLVVITWRHKHIADELDWQFEQNLFNNERGIEVKLDTGVIQGIRLDIHCRSPRNHVNGHMTGPVYHWGDGRILYDPSGIAQWGEDCVKQLLKDNPDFLKKLKKFHDQHQAWKKDNTIVREYETQLEFGDSIDLSKLVRNYRSFTEGIIEKSKR